MTGESAEPAEIPSPEVVFPHEYDAYIPFDHKWPSETSPSSGQHRTHDYSVQAPSLSSSNYFSKRIPERTPLHNNLENELDIKIEDGLLGDNKHEDGDLPTYASSSSSSPDLPEIENTIFRLHNTEREDNKHNKGPRTSLRRERRTKARMLQASPTNGGTTLIRPSVVGVSKSRTLQNANKSSSSITRSSVGRRFNSPDREGWQIQKAALEAKFGEQGWVPRKRLSPDALEGIRALHAQYPDKFTTPVLAEQFEVSPEAIRRILKSKWQPNAEEAEDRRLRWDKRGETIWKSLVTKGIHPPKKWREMGIGAGSRALRPQEQKSMSSQRGSSKKTSVQNGAKWAGSLASRIS